MTYRFFFEPSIGSFCLSSSFFHFSANSVEKPILKPSNRLVFFSFLTQFFLIFLNYLDFWFGNLADERVQLMNFYIKQPNLT